MRVRISYAALIKKYSRMINAIYGDSIRDIVIQANELGITKDNFITMVSDRNQWYLIYGEESKQSDD